LRDGAAVTVLADKPEAEKAATAKDAQKQN
jgi:hypothetical protein